MQPASCFDAIVKKFTALLVMLAVHDHFITRAIVLEINLAESLVICSKYFPIIIQAVATINERVMSLKLRTTAVM